MAITAIKNCIKKYFMWKNLFAEVYYKVYKKTYIENIKVIDYGKF